MTKVQIEFNQLVGKFSKNQEGVAAIEYALIAAATGLALASTLPTVQSALTSTYGTILGYFA